MGICMSNTDKNKNLIKNNKNNDSNNHNPIIKDNKDNINPKYTENDNLSANSDSNFEISENSYKP